MRTPFLLATLACASLSAGNLESNVGVGVGTMIFKGKDGLCSQVCAATTNGIFMNQTFAISSGTLMLLRMTALLATAASTISSPITWTPWPSISPPAKVKPSMLYSN